MASTSSTLLRRAWRAAAPDAKSGSAFRVLSWNVLADGLAQHGDFTYPPAPVLDFEYRWPLMEGEIRRADADVVALYEMNHAERLATTFGSTHALLFVPKIASAAVRMGFPPDGIAVLVRRSRFDVLRVNTVYYQAEDGTVANQNAIVALLRDRVADRTLLVGATHLKAKAGAVEEATRDRQMEQFLDHVADLHGRHAPSATVICGDWNGAPSEPLYRRAIFHPLRFVSVYSSMPRAAQLESGVEARAGAEPDWTTWKWRRAGDAAAKEKCATIDYLMVAGDSDVTVGATVELPSKEDVGPHALPCAAYPSDHMALAAEFRWK